MPGIKHYHYTARYDHDDGRFYTTDVDPEPCYDVHIEPAAIGPGRNWFRKLRRWGVRLSVVD